MLTQTNYTVDTALFQEACQTAPESWTGKTTINKPTGNFFYDPWELNDEYKDTVWQTLYDSLPLPKGEARLIVLGPGQCYQSHADIDDRYHLNILGNESFLIDLDCGQMHRLEQDGIWYDMDAGRKHTAANFGRIFRIQLVVRKLLNKNKLFNPVVIRLSPNIKNEDYARYIFDNTLSSWLNLANKNIVINNFNYKGCIVNFEVESVALNDLRSVVPKEFDLDIL